MKELIIQKWKNGVYMKENGNTMGNVKMIYLVGSEEQLLKTNQFLLIVTSEKGIVMDKLDL